ncbi:MAG TPA: flagellar export chaperone FliS [Vicinamibacterales bacterium]
MIAYSRGAAAYRQVEAQSRSPLELVVMLYDGALARLTEGAAAAARGDVRARGVAVSKALTIIGSLQETLNLTAGGDVAAELDRLYTYASGRLLDVSLKGDVSGIQEVHRLLSGLREAWHQIAQSTTP